MWVRPPLGPLIMKYQHTVKILDPFYITYDGKYYHLWYNGESVRIWNENREGIERWDLSYAAFYWPGASNKHHEIMMKLITNDFYRKIWISMYGNTYEIPDNWYIESLLNNV